MQVKELLKLIDADYFTGVPDSLLKPFSDELYATYGIDPMHHVICANEGNAAALAAGYHMATGKTAVVYLQNSGEGNIVNPVASLLNDRVYAIPVLFVVGWRGEPGVHDEPQHIFQGEVTETLLRDLEIAHFVIGKETTVQEASEAMERFRKESARGRSSAFVIRKGALEDAQSVSFSNAYTLLREDAIRHILVVSGDDPVVATTGKAGRELFELRTQAEETHARDFLTVGSMGHCSSIALGIALQKKDKRIWCIDGDGAALMHMGALPVIASCNPDNLIHIVINNGAHETVGGQPTVMKDLSVADIAASCGYPSVFSVSDGDALDEVLQSAVQKRVLTLIEVKCRLGARADLGRPTTSAVDNKKAFMDMLSAI